MTQILSQFLSLVLLYGYPTLVLAIFLSAIGMPLPLTSLLLAAGSFAAVGSLNIWILIPLVTLTAILCDIMGFYIGRILGPYVLKKITRSLRISSETMKKSETAFDRYGFLSIFLSRWLFTFFGLPVNLIAGSSDYPLSKFIIAASIGEAIWASMYITLGYIFGADWELIVQYLGSVPAILTLCVFGVGLLVLGIRLRRSYRL